MIYQALPVAAPVSVQQVFDCLLDSLLLILLYWGKLHGFS